MKLTICRLIENRLPEHKLSKGKKLMFNSSASLLQNHMLAVAFRLSKFIVMFELLAIGYTENLKKYMSENPGKEFEIKCQPKKDIWKNYVIVILIMLVVPLFYFFLNHIEIVVKVK
jgi:hypothetical protein